MQLRETNSYALSTAKNRRRRSHLITLIWLFSIFHTRSSENSSEQPKRKSHSTAINEKRMENELEIQLFSQHKDIAPSMIIDTSNTLPHTHARTNYRIQFVRLRRLNGISWARFYAHKLWWNKRQLWEREFVVCVMNVYCVGPTIGFVFVYTCDTRARLSRLLLSKIVRRDNKDTQAGVRRRQV